MQQHDLPEDNKLHANAAWAVASAGKHVQTHKTTRPQPAPDTAGAGKEAAPQGDRFKHVSFAL